MVALDMSSGVLPGTYLGAGLGGQGAARTLPPITLSVAGPALTNTVTRTSLLPAAAKAVLPAGSNFVGRAIRVVATGIVSNIVTTPGTLTLDIQLGSVIAWNGGAVALNVAAKTNVSFRFEALLTVRTVGSGTTATVIGVGRLESESVVGAAAGSAITAMMPASAPVVGTGFDSTIDLAVDLFGTFSVNNAGNSIQVLEYALDTVPF